MSKLQRKTITEDPPNRETPLEALLTELTPNELFYVRSNFSVPKLDAATHTIKVAGEVVEPRSFRLSDLQALGARTSVATFECAGNARLSMNPVPDGTAWGWGAASTAEFTGVPLASVLDAAGLNEDVVEIAFAGADGGTLPDGRTIQFERSLPIDTALRPDVLLAWNMNGDALPHENGAPVRLVVPGWYGVASVKWISEIRALSEPLEAHFQTERYVYTGEQGLTDGTPVREMRVRSLIAHPCEGSELEINQECLVEGVAWSGYGAVEAVEVSVDGGATWEQAKLDDRRSEATADHVARRWSWAWTPDATGDHQILARARDSQGAQQPLEPVWNQLGYGNNLIHNVSVHVRQSA